MIPFPEVVHLPDLVDAVIHQPLASEGAGDDEGDVDAVAAHDQAVHAFPETHRRRRRRDARGTVEVGSRDDGWRAVPFL